MDIKDRLRAIGERRIQEGHPVPVDSSTLLALARRTASDAAAVIAGRTARWEKKGVVRTCTMWPDFVYTDDIRERAAALQQDVGDIAQRYGTRSRHSFEEIKARVDALADVPVAMHYAQPESNDPETILELDAAAFSSAKEHFPYRAMQRSMETHPEAWKKMIEERVVEDDHPQVRALEALRAADTKPGFKGAGVWVEGTRDLDSGSHGIE